MSSRGAGGDEGSCVRDSWAGYGDRRRDPSSLALLGMTGELCCHSEERPTVSSGPGRRRRSSHSPYCDISVLETKKISPTNTNASV